MCSVLNHWNQRVPADISDIIQLQPSRLPDAPPAGVSPSFISDVRYHQLIAGRVTRERRTTQSGVGWSAELLVERKRCTLIFTWMLLGDLLSC